MELGKKLPHDVESERVVLGGIIMDHPQSREMFEMLTTDDFFLSQNKAIFTSLKALFDDGKETSYAMLHDMLVSSGELEEAGGVAYMSTIADGLSNRMKLDQYATRIRQTFCRREFMKQCDRWTDTGNDNITEILDEAREFISELAIQANTQQTGKSFKEASIELVASMHDPDPPQPLMTSSPARHPPVQSSTSWIPVTSG